MRGHQTVVSKKRKPAIELTEPPQDYYDNAMPRKRQLRSKDEIKAGNSRGTVGIYRKPKKKKIMFARPEVKLNQNKRFMEA
jgi:hypothetical protein